MSTFSSLNQNGLRIDLMSRAGTLVRFNTALPDAAAATWWVTLLEGWESPDARQKWIDKAGDHGSIPTESYFDKRALVLAGIIQAARSTDPWTDQANFWNAWNYITNLLGEDMVGSENFSKLTVWEIPYPKFVYVKVTGRPKFAIHAGYWEFSIPLISADPHKYLVNSPASGSW